MISAARKVPSASGHGEMCVLFIHSISILVAADVASRDIDISSTLMKDKIVSDWNTILEHEQDELIRQDELI